MALPLKFPIIFNVTPWIFLMYCFGFSISCGFFVYGSFKGRDGDQFLFCLSFVIAFVTVISICISVYTRMHREIDRRSPRIFTSEHYTPM